MARVVLLEILDQRGGVRSRTRLSSFPASIGRAYDNDVIVDDPHVDPHHFRLTELEDGTLAADDLGSVNGLFRGKSKQRVPRIPLSSGIELRIGRTMLRFRALDDPVPEAVPDRPVVPGPLTRLESTRVSLGVLAATYLIFVVLSYFQSYEDVSVVGSVIEPFKFSWLFALWAGVWSVVSRATTHHFAFLRHFVVAGLAGVALLLVLELTEWLDFIAPGSSLGQVVGLVFTTALGVALLSAHLAIASSAQRRARWQWALGTVVGIVAFAGASSLAERDVFSVTMDDPGDIKPAGLGWMRTTSVQTFAEESRRLRERVDSLASQE